MCLYNKPITFAIRQTNIKIFIAIKFTYYSTYLNAEIRSCLLPHQTLLQLGNLPLGYLLASRTILYSINTRK